MLFRKHHIAKIPMEGVLILIKTVKKEYGLTYSFQHFFRSLVFFSTITIDSN